MIHVAGRKAAATITVVRRVAEVPNPIDQGQRGRHRCMHETDKSCKEATRKSHDFPLVSIVTVVHNAVDTLERTIQSVLAQTYPNIEFIVIDGGSVDGTLNILHKYRRHIAYWVSEPDRGISDAFNKGVAASSGEIIGILSADDWYEPDAVERVVRIFENDRQAGVVCGNARYHDSSGVLYVAAGDPARLCSEMTVNHASCFARSTMYDRFGLFDENYKFAMDYELMLRLKISGVRFVSVTDVLCNVSRMGASDRNWLQSIVEVRKAKQKHGERFTRPYEYWMIARSFMSRTLCRAGFSFIVNRYRRSLSIVKKH